MQQSNTYIIVFTAVLTIVLGGLLSMASVGLKPMQQKSIELDTKKKILGAVTSLEGKKGNEILSYYDGVIESVVVNIQGDAVAQTEKGVAAVAEEVDIAKNYKKEPEQRLYPVFKYHKEGKPEEVEAYIFPVYGNGLWGPIWGYVALDTDLNTIKGVSFDHETETPGLGARITDPQVSGRYQGKKIYNEAGELISVAMLKGESNPENRLDAHNINGLSGATLTANGVNEMVKSYLEKYAAYISKIKKNS